MLVPQYLYDKHKRWGLTRGFKWGKIFKTFIDQGEKKNFHSYSLYTTSCDIDPSALIEDNDNDILFLLLLQEASFGFVKLS